MPKLDLTPARKPDYLETYCDYAKERVAKYTERGEKDKALYFSNMLRLAQYEHIASLYIKNAWLKVEQERLKG